MYVDPRLPKHQNHILISPYCVAKTETRDHLNPEILNPEVERCSAAMGLQTWQVVLHLKGTLAGIVTGTAAVTGKVTTPKRNQIAKSGDAAENMYHVVPLASCSPAGTVLFSNTYRSAALVVAARVWSCLL